MILTKPMEEGKLDIFALATNREYDSYVYFRVNHIFAREMSNLTFNVYDDVLAYLEDGWKINNMTLDMHYNLWQELCDNITLGWKEDYPGMRLYIEYCEKRGITKEQIDKAGLEVPDILSELHQLDEMPERETRNEKSQKVR